MQHRSTQTDVITVHHDDVHLQIQPDELVDLNAPIARGVTLRQALGRHASSFAEAEPASKKKTTAVPAAKEQE